MFSFLSLRIFHLIPFFLDVLNIVLPLYPVKRPTICLTDTPITIAFIKLTFVAPQWGGVWIMRYFKEKFHNGVRQSTLFEFFGLISNTALCPPPGVLFLNHYL